jgi:hypothetical protein
MALSLAQLREAFQKNQTTSSGSGSPRWKLFYPFFKIDIDQRAIFRFLPDNDETNPLAFLVENMTHRLTVNGKQRTVPCLKMYGKKCPCCDLSAKYYGEKNEQMGLKYWRKQEFIGQGLVNESPIEWEDENSNKVRSSVDIQKAGGNPVRLISIGPKIYKLIQNAFTSEDSELENAPYELFGGHDFRLRKSKQGEYADYSLSSFSTKPSDVDASLIESLTLFNLADYREPEISAEEMEALIQADATGSAYSRDGEAPKNSAPAKSSAPAAKSAAEDSADDTPPFTETSKPAAAAAASTSDADRRAAIMETIRQRNKQRQAESAPE